MFPALNKRPCGTRVCGARNLTLTESVTLSLYIPLSRSLSISTYFVSRTSPIIIITVMIEINRRSADNNNDNKLLYYLQRSVYRVVDVIQVPQRSAPEYLYLPNYMYTIILWCLTRVEPVHSQGHNVLCHFHIASPVIWVNSNRFQGLRAFRNSIFV